MMPCTARWSSMTLSEIGASEAYAGAAPEDVRAGAREERGTWCGVGSARVGGDV